MNKIISKERFSEKVFKFEIEAPLIAKSRKAGHFVIVRVGEKGERMPLTIAGSDLKKGTITLVVQEVGLSSTRLCELNEGDYITDVVGPLGQAIQRGEFSDVAEDITYLIQQCRKKMENNEYNNLEEEIRRANDLNGQLSLLKRKELQRIQSQSGSIRVSMVYLTMVQEAQNVVTYTINLMKVSRKFQMETEMP